jgi:hypothetical protein
VTRRPDEDPLFCLVEPGTKCCVCGIEVGDDYWIMHGEVDLVYCDPCFTEETELG